MKETLIKIIKNRIVQIVLALTFVSIVAFYVFINVLSLDDGKHSFAIPAENNIIEDYIQTSVQKSNDPAMPEGGVREKGYHIHINLEVKQMYVYKNGELIKNYPCSGGKPSTPSPEGTWKIINKGEWGEGFGGAWMGFNVPWGKYGIHGTVYPWEIGKRNGSEGCIRMLNKDVRELYKIIPYGTTVTIVSPTRVFRTMKNGDIGTDVKEVQRDLAKLGYYKGSPDGKFGGYLKTCVEKFQKDNKIYTSGKVDRRTLDTLKKKVQEFEGNPAQ